MENKYFQNIKFLSITILIFSLMPFVVPQAFAGASACIVDPTFINSVVAELGESTSSIVVTCTNPTFIGASITGNRLFIDDSPDFSSVDVFKDDLTCDGGFANNIINTPFLTDLKSYYVKLTVFTDIPDFESSYVYSDPFVQPDGGIIILNDRSPGSYTIQFRDIGVTDNIGPNIAFGTKPTTLTVTDHNANIDLSVAEKITVKINDVDTVLVETGGNTGIFTGPITPGASVSYDPGTLGVARATIEIDFDVVLGDPDSTGDIIIEDVLLNDEQILLGFDGLTPVNHPVRIAFADGGKVTDGEDVKVTMSYADADLRTAAAPDVGLPLTGFAFDELYDDNTDGSGFFGVGETVYNDIDADGLVSIGDVRLANAATGGFLDGSIVPGVDDPLLLQMYYQKPGFGYDLITASFATGSHDTDAKTVVSNPTLDIGFGPVLVCISFGCHTIEGNYVLLYDLGTGGGGGGGISKAGFVVNALAGLGGLSSSGGGNSPPSFDGQSSFAIIEGGQEGFGGILSDNDDKTLEQTKTFKVGQKASLTFDYAEGGGMGNIE